MKIKLAKNTYWDTELEVQNEETIEWINSNVLQKLGVNSDSEEFIIPELDKYNRPTKWIYKTDTFTIEITREYISPAKWAKKCDTVKVFAND